MTTPTVKEAIEVVRGCCKSGCPKEECNWIEVLISAAQEAERLREALQYIVDHKWVNGSEVIPDGSGRWKWINEFVYVARTALSGEKGNK